MTDFEKLVDAFGWASESVGYAGDTPPLPQDVEKQKATRQALLAAIQEATHPTEVYEVVEDDGEIYYHRSMWLTKDSADAEVADGKLEFDDGWSTTHLTIKVRRISYLEEADE